jgi:hypothetical protein
MMIARSHPSLHLVAGQVIMSVNQVMAPAQTQTWLPLENPIKKDSSRLHKSLWGKKQNPRGSQCPENPPGILGTEKGEVLDTPAFRDVD